MSQISVHRNLHWCNSKLLEGPARVSAIMVSVCIIPKALPSDQNVWNGYFVCVHILTYYKNI